ncbi:MAG: hypothetical protein K8H99_09115, partial [Nitrospirae bacterium]|nr:hypothetical protein [Fimbriimonadaceae bacterium]
MRTGLAPGDNYRILAAVDSRIASPAQDNVVASIPEDDAGDPYSVVAERRSSLLLRKFPGDALQPGAVAVPESEAAPLPADQVSNVLMSQLLTVQRLIHIEQLKTPEPLDAANLGTDPALENHRFPVTRYVTSVQDTPIGIGGKMLGVAMQTGPATNANALRRRSKEILYDVESLIRPMPFVALETLEDPSHIPAAWNLFPEGPFHDGRARIGAVASKTRICVAAPGGKSEAACTTLISIPCELWSPGTGWAVSQIVKMGLAGVDAELETVADVPVDATRVRVNGVEGDIVPGSIAGKLLKVAPIAGTTYRFPVLLYDDAYEHFKPTGTLTYRPESGAEASAVRNGEAVNLVNHWLRDTCVRVRLLSSEGYGDAIPYWHHRPIV